MSNGPQFNSGKHLHRKKLGRRKNSGNSCHMADIRSTPTGHIQLCQSLLKILLWEQQTFFNSFKFLTSFKGWHWSGLNIVCQWRWKDFRERVQATKMQTKNSLKVNVQPLVWKCHYTAHHWSVYWYWPKTDKNLTELWRCCASVTAHQWSIRPTCHPARSLQLIGIRPIRSGAIIAHECDRKQARDPTFITGRRSFFSWRRTGTIIRRVMARLVMEGGIPHRGSPLGYDQHRVIKIANLYTDGLVNRIPHILVSNSWVGSTITLAELTQE